MILIHLSNGYSNSTTGKKRTHTHSGSVADTVQTSLAVVVKEDRIDNSWSTCLVIDWVLLDTLAVHWIVKSFKGGASI